MEPDAYLAKVEADWVNNAVTLETSKDEFPEELTPEPLYSAETLILNIDGQAERLEEIARGLEEARETRDWEEVVDLVYDLVSESEILAEVESSLKSATTKGDNSE